MIIFVISAENKHNVLLQRSSLQRNTDTCGMKETPAASNNVSSFNNKATYPISIHFLNVIQPRKFNLQMQSKDIALNKGYP